MNYYPLRTLHILIVYLVAYISLLQASEKVKLFESCLYDHSPMKNGLENENSVRQNSQTWDVSKIRKKEDFYTEYPLETGYHRKVKALLCAISAPTFTHKFITNIVLSFLVTTIRPRSWLSDPHVRCVSTIVVFGYASARPQLLLAGEKANLEGIITLWSLSSGQLLDQFLHPAWVTAVSVAPSAEFMVSTTYDSLLRVWNFTSRTCFTLEGPTIHGYHWCIILADNKTVIATDADRCQFYIWDVKSRTYIRKCTGQVFFGYRGCVHVLPDATTLVFGCHYSSQHGRFIKRLNLKSGSYECYHSSSDVYTCAVAGNGSTLVSGDTFGEILVWEITTGERIDGARFSEKKCVDVAITSDGRIIFGMITSHNLETVLQSWELKNRKIKKLHLHPMHGYGRSLLVSPDDNFVAVAVERTIYLWYVESGKLMGLFRYKYWVDWFYISRDSQFIIATTKEKRNGVRVYVWEIRKFTY